MKQLVLGGHGGKIGDTCASTLMIHTYQISTVFGLSPQVGSSEVASVRKGRTSWRTFGMSTHHKFSNKGDSGVPSLSVSLPHMLTIPRGFCRSY